MNAITDSRGNKTLNYDFSPGGQLNSIADSEDERSDFLYDAASRLTAILAPNGERVNFLFDAGGRLRETSMANGVSAKYSYDAGNKLQLLTNSTSVGQVSQHQYGYDNVGRRTSHIENIVGTTTSYTYNYDNLDRMSSVYQNGGATLVESYGYDQFNNRRTRQPNGSTAKHYLYDAAQQLNSIRDGSDVGAEIASFVYDDSGNMVSKSEGGVTRALTYDAQERLVQVSGSNIATENYAYDHEGRRIEKTSGATTSRYIYSGASMWSEYSSNWTAALAHYTYTGLDKRIIRSTATDARYYHNDGLGSVVAVSNAAGATQASTRFDAWGSIIASTGSTPFGFTGREKDATGLGYFRARYYDSTVGRFTQRDPIGFRGGLNPYTYVSNSPQNFTDPLGLIQAPVNEWIGWESSYDGHSGGKYSAPFINSPSIVGKTRVELGFNDVALGYAQHSFLTASGPDGQYAIIRGQPSKNMSSPASLFDAFLEGIGLGSFVSGDFGNLNVIGGQAAYNSEARKPLVGTQLVGYFDSFDSVANTLGGYSNSVNSAQIPYLPLSNNSNAVAFGAAEALLGFRPESNFTTPGSDAVLPLQAEFPSYPISWGF